MENIEKNLFTYALFDKESEIYSVLVTGTEDKECIDFYNTNFKELLKSLESYYKDDKLKQEKQNFIDKVHNSCIYRIGYFDYFKGEFVNDKVMLVDLFDFDFESEENVNNEKK